MFEICLASNKTGLLSGGNKGGLKVKEDKYFPPRRRRIKAKANSLLRDLIFVVGAALHVDMDRTQSSPTSLVS